MKRAQRQPEVIPPYHPNYKEVGVDPQPFHFKPGSETILVSKGSPDNPRFPRPLTSVAFSSFDDHESAVQPFVDNNEFVDPVVYEGEKQYIAQNPTYQSRQELAAPPSGPPVAPLPRGYETAGYGQPAQIKERSQTRERVTDPVIPRARVSRAPVAPPKPVSIFASVHEGDYCLFVEDDLVSNSPSKDDIQSQVEMLLYGDHPSYPRIEVPFDVITVLRKSSIKTGVYLE